MTRETLIQALSDRMDDYFGCVGDSVDVDRLADVVADLIGKTLDQIGAEFDAKMEHHAHRSGLTAGSLGAFINSGQSFAYQDAATRVEQEALRLRTGQ